LLAGSAVAKLCFHGYPERCHSTVWKQECLAMRVHLSVILLLVPLTLQAADPPHNTLTPKEIASGWILLFDGKTTFGWTSPNDSKWTILDGMLAPQSGKPGLLVTTTTFTDYELVFEFQAASKGAFTLLTCCDAQGKPREGNQPEGLMGRESGWWHADVTVLGGRVVAEDYRQLGQAIRRKLGRGVEAPDKRSGHIAFKGTGFVVRNVKLKPMLPLYLLNGKNLSGWKEHPGKKSKFSVTKEGWLSVKDGPGDLQTEGQWADFVLQLECKTLGKHLNSGVFFRCLPGQYQQGYEAQIHNGFGPDKEYTLEVFDPQTNKLIQKKKEKYTAIDYGTGAIYRRQPARFQAAQDNEWFTMTVHAHGRHLATWVNGLQVVDWTDHRPLADNARQGAYLKKGPISLQGHDPTTDLLFRNLRIAELPQKKE
jgi:hypothetical protein